MALLDTIKSHLAGPQELPVIIDCGDTFQIGPGQILDSTGAVQDLSGCTCTGFILSAYGGSTLATMTATVSGSGSTSAVKYVLTPATTAALTPLTDGGVIGYMVLMVTDGTDTVTFARGSVTQKRVKT